MDEIKDKLAEELETWAEEFVMNRATQLRVKNINASGELIESLEYDLDKKASEDAIKLLIAFNEYGRIVDMRKVQHDKWGREAVSRIEDWIKEKGLLQKWLPKFMKKYNRRTIPPDVLNRMAWGVMRNKTYAWKPKKWYNKSKSAAIDDLYNNVAEAMPDHVGDQMEKELTQKDLKKIRAKFLAYAKAKGR